MCFRCAGSGNGSNGGVSSSWGVVSRAAANCSTIDMRGFATPFSMRSRSGRLTPAIRENVFLVILLRVRRRFTFVPKTYERHSADGVAESEVCSGFSCMGHRLSAASQYRVIVRLRFGRNASKLHVTLTSSGAFFVWLCRSLWLTAIRERQSSSFRVDLLCELAQCCDGFCHCVSENVSRETFAAA